MVKCPFDVCFHNTDGICQKEDIVLEIIGEDEGLDCACFEE